MSLETSPCPSWATRSPFVSVSAALSYLHHQRQKALQNCNLNNGNVVCSEIVDLNCAGELKMEACHFLSAFHKINVAKGPDWHLQKFCPAYTFFSFSTEEILILVTVNGIIWTLGS